MIEKTLKKQEELIQIQENLIKQIEEKSTTVYAVRENGTLIALFPNEQRCRYYCQEHDANLTYQKERWVRL